MRTRDAITQKLMAAFAPVRIEVADESHLHEGHAGHRPAERPTSGFISWLMCSQGRAGSSAIA